MAPQGPDLDAIPPGQLLPLADWLKLLASRGVDMRVAMALAAKIYNSHNTKDRLAELDNKKLMTLVTDKDQRKTVVNAVKGIATGEKKAKKRNRDSDLLEPLSERSVEKDYLPKSLEFNEITNIEEIMPVTVSVNRAPIKTAWTYVVARRLGFDLQEALSIAHVYVHFSSLKHALMLGNILNPQETREAEEEISELPGWRKENEKVGESSRSGAGGAAARRGRGRMWGNAREGEKGQSSQPWVDILRAKIPVIERQDGTWRAIEKGVPVEPSVAYLYITKALKQYTPHVLGAMQIVASSYEPEELNRVGMSLYNDFKPDVVEWGQRGTVDCAKILDTAKEPVDGNVAESAKGVNGPSGEGGDSKPIKAGEAETTDPRGGDPAPEKVEPDPTEVGDGESDLSEVPDLNGEDAAPPTKKSRTAAEDAKPTDPGGGGDGGGGMSWEEYEAMLEKEDEAGGFMEGVDLYDPKI